MALSPDGLTLATGGEDGNVILWDITDPRVARRIGAPLHEEVVIDPLSGHANWIQALAFRPDGRVLATASEDGSVTLWNLGGIVDLRHELQQDACSMSGAGLRPDQWARYIPDIPYQSACGR